MNEYDFVCPGCGAGKHFSVPSDLADVTTLLCEDCDTSVGVAYPIACTNGCGLILGQRILPPEHALQIQTGPDGEPTTGLVCEACKPAYWARVGAARIAAREAAMIAREEALLRIRAGNGTEDDYKLILGENNA